MEQDGLGFVACAQSRDQRVDRLLRVGRPGADLGLGPEGEPRVAAVPRRPRQALEPIEQGEGRRDACLAALEQSSGDRERQVHGGARQLAALDPRVRDEIVDQSLQSRSRFRDRGGRLIVYQGWDDIEVTPLNTLDYFDTMTRTMGGGEATADFARLFMMPGVAHCRRGPGADSVDWLSYLEAWVERNEAPDSVTAHHLTREQNYLGLPRPRFPLPQGSFDRTVELRPYEVPES